MKQIVMLIDARKVLCGLSLAAALLLATPASAEDRIHARMRCSPSASSSHCSRSADLYRSCEPEVEWPWGWVTSCTWKSAGM